MVEHFDDNNHNDTIDLTDLIKSYS